MEKYSVAEHTTDDNIICRMPFGHWITKAIDTYSEYLTLTAFPWRQWLRERASVLHLYVHCLSCWDFMPSDNADFTVYVVGE